jgi:hypothetical protein
VVSESFRRRPLDGLPGVVRCSGVFPLVFAKTFTVVLIFVVINWLIQ